MSEAERKRRLEYRENRKRWIIRLAAALAAVLVITAALSVFAIHFNKTRYIDYKESSTLDYGVFMKPNDFYESSYLGKEYEYVASLIDKVDARFVYNLHVNSEQPINYEYTYSVDAVLEIVSKSSGKVIYTISDELIEEKQLSGTGKDVLIQEYVLADYVKYNQIASSFISKYGLKDTTSNLVIRMNVSVISNSQEFHKGQNDKEYTASLSIPLTTKTVDVSITSQTPDAAGQFIAYINTHAAKIFRILSIVSGSVSVLLAIAIVCFIYLTRNTDITYEIKVKRLVRDYRSYIQKLRNNFDMSGYQILRIDTFNEMLEIRDIIQSPILMNENCDKTCTEFFIPTDTKLLYLFDIRVDDYDEIYSDSNSNHTNETAAIKEEVVILENDVDEKALEEALAQPDVDLSDIDFIPDNDDKFPPKDEKDAVEVVGVVWKEKERKNKVYRYSPNGENLHEGDTVLVPTETTENREIIRKAAVAHANHKVDASHAPNPLRKIIGVIRRKAENMLTSDSQSKRK